MIDTARRALEFGHQASVAVPLAALAIDAGRESEARRLGDELGGSLENQGRAFAKLIEARLALNDGRINEAIQLLRGVLQLADHWLVRFDLGVAYVKGGHFAQALSEFETCLRRRGEASAVFLDDVPTFRYLAPLRVLARTLTGGSGHECRRDR